MKKLNPTGRLNQVAIAVFGVVGALDLGVGIYHLTHQGTGSGITELILAVLLSIGAYLTLHTRQKGGPVITPGRSRKAGITIIALIALTFFALGIYHLSHQGLPSGIIELCMTGLLAIIVYLISRPKSH